MIADGVVIPIITVANVNKLEIPLPTLKMQKEIVKEIEGYQKVIDDARAVLDHCRPRIPVHPDRLEMAIGAMSTIVRGSSARAQGDPKFFRGPMLRDAQSLARDVPMIKLGFGVILCALICACGSQQEAASSTFSETYSCPRDQITVDPIKTVTMRELWLQANPLPQPPADIQADPERLAVWNKTQDKAREGPLRGVERYKLFHVTGCHQAQDYACYCAPHQKGASTTRGTTQDSCGCQAPPVPIK